MDEAALKTYLDEQVERYNHTDFIVDDPISIPHLFERKADIEIIGYIIATISWGQRKTIIKNGHLLCEIMGQSPQEFVLHAKKEDLRDLKFVHRTFNADDLRFFIEALKRFYETGGGLEAGFNKNTATMSDRIAGFRQLFLETPHEKRAEKHLSNPLTGSASKRINMFLRWMVRNDKKGVDFGLWNTISPAELYIPLDVHTGNVARKLGLIKRKANDWKALEELMERVRTFDPVDPCKYDFALFGLGASGTF